MSRRITSNDVGEFDGAGLLLAVAVQWLKDAQRDPDELPALAAWLDVDQAQLGKAIQGRRFAVPQ